MEMLELELELILILSLKKTFFLLQMTNYFFKDRNDQHQSPDHSI